MTPTLMYALYYLLLVVLILVTLPLWVWRYFGTQKYKGTVAQRLGFHRPARHATRRIWVHAVSVGEVMAVRGLVQRLGALFPGEAIVLSTVTKTGQQTARQSLPFIREVFYLPLDLPWTLRRVTQTVRPRCLIVMETELWPGLFRAMEKEGIPVIVVNGRLSPGSFRNYRKFSPIMKRFLDPVHRFAMQSDSDAQRMARIGARPERIRVTGTIKYDQAMQLPGPDEMAHLTQRLPRPDGMVWMAASTHPGEEEVILSTFARLQQTFPTLLLILVPRHPERTAKVATLINAHGYTPSLFSQTSHTHPHPTPWGKSVLLVDEIGWLARLYGYAHIAFMGGSLIPHGGQNMLEPAAWGIPTLFGPHTFNFRDVSAQLLEGNAALRIPNPEALLPAMQALLTDTDRRKTMGAQAKRVVANNVGALERTITVIQEVLQEHEEGQTKTAG